MADELFLTVQKRTVKSFLPAFWRFKLHNDEEDIDSGVIIFYLDDINLSSLVNCWEMEVTDWPLFGGVLSTSRGLEVALEQSPAPLQAISTTKYSTPSCRSKSLNV